MPPRLGDRLLPLYDLVADLVEERVDCRGWEFPDPDEEEKEVVTDWIAWGLTCLRWTLLYDARAQPEVTYADTSAFLIKPPPRPAITPPAPTSCSTTTRPAGPILTGDPPGTHETPQTRRDPAETFAAIIGLILITLVMLTSPDSRRPCTAPRSRATSTRADHARGSSPEPQFGPPPTPQENAP